MSDAAQELWLSPNEVGELTGCPVRWSAQCRKLAGMGIPFRVNGCGRPLVERAAVVSAPRQQRARPRTAPNWGAHRGAKTQTR